jgi:hypothetical protein
MKNLDKVGLKSELEKKCFAYHNLGFHIQHTSCCWFQCRLEVELLEEGACHVLPASDDGASQVLATGAGAPSGTSGRDKQLGQDMQQQQHQQQQGSIRGGYEGLGGFTPQWVMLEANAWRKRVAVLQRFVCAARTVVLRLRAQKRLERLRVLAGG